MAVKTEGGLTVITVVVLLLPLITIQTLSSAASATPQECPHPSPPELIVQRASDEVRQVAISSDGRFLASSASKGPNYGTGSSICVWQTSDRKLMRAIKTSAHVASLAFSPDGKLLAAGMVKYGEGHPAGGEAVVFRISDAKVMGSLNLHAQSVAFSPDGIVLAIGTDKDVNIVQVGSFITTRVLQPKHALRGLYISGNVAFSPDGKLVVATACIWNGKDDMDAVIHMWSAETGTLTREIKAHKQAISCLAFSADGTMLASASRDKTVKIWRTSDGKLIIAHNGHRTAVDKGIEDPITSLSFSPAGQFLASSGTDRAIRLFDLIAGAMVRAIDKGDEDSGLAFSLDGTRLFSGSPLRAWRASNGRLIGNFSGPKQMDQLESHGFSPLNRSMVFSGDDLYVLWASSTGSLMSWDVEDARFTRFNPGYRKEIQCVTFSPDSSALAMGTVDSVDWRDNIGVWQLTDFRRGRSFEHQTEKCSGTGKAFPTTLSFSPDGRYLFSVAADPRYATSRCKTFKGWQISEGTPLEVIEQQAQSSLSYSLCGSLVSFGYPDNTIRIFKVPDGKSVRTLMAGKPISKFNSGITAVSFSHDGSLLAGGGYEGVYLWDVSSGRLIRTQSTLVNNSPMNVVHSLIFSPDDKYLAIQTSNLSGETRPAVKLYRITDGKLIKDLDECYYRPVFSPNSEFLATNCSYNDQDMRLINLNDGTIVQQFSGHRNIAFASDGKLLALWNQELKQLELWKNRTSGEKYEFANIATLQAFQDGEHVIFTPEGYYDSSPEGASYLNWTFSDPPFPEAFNFEQFESLYKRPDIVKARMSGNYAAGKPVPSMTRPPYIELAEHQLFKEIDKATYPLKIITSAIDEVKTLRVFVNGKPAREMSVNAKEKTLSLDVPLYPGDNRITTIAYNEKGFSSNPKYVDVLCKRSDLPKPNLYVLGIGISKYPYLPQEWQLSYAHSDAKAMIESFKGQEGRVFGSVSSKVLTNEEVTEENLTEALGSLESMSENDVAVVFLAGHGVMCKDGSFYFLTPTGSLDEPQKGGVNWKTLGESLAKVKGRVLILLDACHSGNVTTETVVPNDELAQKLRAEGRSGLMVFTASKGRQSALESPDLGGGFGAFAYSVTQALGPKTKEADLNGNGFVEFMELVDYVSQSVDKETEGEQTPWLARKELFGDLPIASVQ